VVDDSVILSELAPNQFSRPRDPIRRGAMKSLIAGSLDPHELEDLRKSRRHEASLAWFRLELQRVLAQPGSTQRTLAGK
jgi:hypothetical protein